MKSKLLSIISAILLFTICFTACKAQESEPAPTNISYCQNSLYVGKTADYNVSLSEGISEILFVADGKTVETENFVELKIIPTSQDLINQTLKYKLTGEKGEIEDVLDKDAFGAYFSATPDMSVIGKPIKLTIMGKSETQVELTDVLAGKLSSSQALSAAREVLNEKLKADGKDREIYVRMINNAEKSDSPYYWYVAFIAAPTDYYSAVVDPASGKIVSTSPATT